MESELFYKEEERNRMELERTWILSKGFKNKQA